MYALTPTITGLPFTTADVAWLPWLLATTRVLPLADDTGIGFSGSVMTKLPSLISAFTVDLSFQAALLLLSTKISYSLFRVKSFLQKS
jgi:hypothetical protein